MWPARASGSDVSAPNPLEAPVTTTTFPSNRPSSDQAAIGADNLTFDTVPLGAGEEGDDLGDVDGLAQPLARHRIGELVVWSGGRAARPKRLLSRAMVSPAP